ncbi:hypothetical protein C8N24_0692 [Solirubrobacter pauli]|uniref:Uncharacterized protein n=1 Tax=Solirubrobacter pauli TaxID=166793 RepID=A0A660L766_9ACTN|nr:hypothetical protein [Solirubrobacter pauli]RKQ90877.1 hypothetical protein C8N24_0692 [Solirubrobacter pauli]
MLTADHDYTLLFRCPMCATANRMPAEVRAALRCGACRLDIDTWLKDAFVDLSAFWRAAIATLATIYRPELYPLLEQALTERHRPCREAAWRALTEPIAIERERGQVAHAPCLLDRLTADQRASLRVRVPRAAAVVGPTTRPSSPALPRQDAAPGRRARPPAAKPYTRPRPEPERAVADRAFDSSSAFDGLSLRELATAARELAAQLENAPPR